MGRGQADVLRIAANMLTSDTRTSCTTLSPATCGADDSITNDCKLLTRPRVPSGHHGPQLFSRCFSLRRIFSAQTLGLNNVNPAYLPRLLVNRATAVNRSAAGQHRCLGFGKPRTLGRLSAARMVPRLRREYPTYCCWPLSPPLSDGGVGVAGSSGVLPVSGAGIASVDGVVASGAGVPASWANAKFAPDKHAQTTSLSTILRPMTSLLANRSRETRAASSGWSLGTTPAPPARVGRGFGCALILRRAELRTSVVGWTRVYCHSPVSISAQFFACGGPHGARRSSR